MSKLVEQIMAGYINSKTIKTEKESLEAVRQNGDALQYVNNQTEKICLEAVRRNQRALQFVSNQTE